MADRLNDLKQKYETVLRTIEQQQVRLQNVHVQDNKLLIRGEAPSEEAKNKVWDQIKLVNPTYDDLTVDLTVNQSAAQAQKRGPASAQENVYTVRPGDTLSALSKKFYGDANQYMTIFNANRDKLSDPDKISPGQQLRIPAA